MTVYVDDVPEHIESTLRWICLALPDAYEEQAWKGTRWMVRKKTFAHVLGVHADADAAARGEPDVLVAFRAAPDEFHVLRNAGHPFLHLGWGRDAIGMVLTDDTDWDEVGELMIESYCVLAPKKLVALIDRPTAADGP